jgi:DNA repair protein RecO (recombination protein O)
MKQQLEGIFIKKIPYNDSLSLAYIYTKENGLLTFLYRNKKKFNSFLFPLSIISITTKLRQNRELNYIEDVGYKVLTYSLRTDVHKLNIAQFISEFIYILSPFPCSDDKMYNFIKNWIIVLEKSTDKLIGIWHIFFLFRMTNFIGIKPTLNYNEANIFFDLVHGEFSAIYNENTIRKDLSFFWFQFLTIEDDIKELAKINLNKSQKYELIDSILRYYLLHFNNNLKINSLEILKELYEIEL